MSDTGYTNKPCRRCKGQGYGGWWIAGGLCFSCQGTGLTPVFRETNRQFMDRITAEYNERVDFINAAWAEFDAPMPQRQGRDGVWRDSPEKHFAMFVEALKSGDTEIAALASSRSRELISNGKLSYR